MYRDPSNLFAGGWHSTEIPSFRLHFAVEFEEVKLFRTARNCPQIIALNRTFILPSRFSLWAASFRGECRRLTETTAENEELLLNNFPSFPMISIHAPSAKRRSFLVGF